MSRPRISKKLRAAISEQANYRCGYCLTNQHIVGTLMEIDHIVPIALGGANEEYNLWLACAACNAYKNDRTVAIDPVSQVETPIFNPRTQKWTEHFQWVEGGRLIEGVTPIGRATIVLLNLNRQELVTSREYWIRAGWHPPNA